MDRNRFDAGQGDVDQVDRLAQNNVARQIDEDAVIEESGIEGGKGRVVETGILSQVGLHQFAAFLPGLTETADLHARRQLAQRCEAQRQPAVDQDDLLARTGLRQQAW